MTSDPSQPSSPSALQRLLQVLDRAGGRSATATELAELIWLAGHSGAPAQATQAGPGQLGHRAPASAPSDPPEPTVPGTDPEPPQAPGSPGVPLLYESDPQMSDAGPRTSLLAPLPPMLAHPLLLQRALRPMRRRVPSHVERELDERNTAYRIARQGASPGSWLPVLRARPERWLTLHLLYDAGPTMPMWRPLLRELHRAIGQTGAFRGIQLLKLTQDGRLRQSPGGRPATLPPRDGRAVTLVLSDCSGPHWYAGNEGAAEWYRVLRSWARTTSLAIVQPLPERLWRRTALPVSAGLLTARGQASPNSALRFTSFDTAGEAPAGLPLPVLEPSARWFAHWAELVAGPPGTRVPGVAAMLPTGLSTVPADLGRPVPRALSPQELVLNFRAHASPQALRLAAHLAVGEPSLPVMRLVQAATEARPEPQHLAEVVLSGLLTTAPGSPAAAGHYVFRPGVREVLLRSLPRSTAARVGAVIQRYAGSRAGEFPVTVPYEHSAEACRASEPLAVVSDETIRNLSGAPAVPADELDTLVEGRYRLTRLRHDGTTSSTWWATDELLGREVALKLFDGLRAGTASGEQHFLADAERLAAFDIQGWARVIGYGMHDGRPYLVTDAVDGEDLGQLLQARGALPLEMIREVGRRTARVLSELHGNGLLHLNLSPSALVLCRDGRVLVTDPGLALGRERRIDQMRYPRPTDDLSGFLPPLRSSKQLVADVAVVDHRSDLYSLGALLYALATGAPPVVGAPAPLPPGFPPYLEALVTDLLAIDPEDRPADAAEVLDRLRSPGAYDEELLRAHRAVRDVDPDGARMGRVLREAVDEVLNGGVTGRYDMKSLTKTEKTHLGSLVDMAIQREFRFEDGREMDFRIAGVDVDCRFSLVFGGWLFPPETLGRLCLLVWANDYQSRWSAGLLRVNEEWLNAGISRDLKATLKAEHRDKILWLWRDVELAENVLLHMSDADREAVFLPQAGQTRLNELFRRLQGRRIGRNAVHTVAQQRDYMKRIRGNGGSRSALRDEGIIILGDYEAHRHIARQLGLPVPREGEFVSARVVPVAPGAGKPVAEMDGGLWSLASPEDPEHPAPRLPSHLPTEASSEHGDGPRRR
ncbi:NaeI family type II restriction endonuclease [Streptomyces coeruleorubidus]|uniref:NaeI family type II restriction endonuclease n=1 Tax=Streptomyces coeruleorubidus TaxID=116188 RepID=UPI0036F67DDC